MARVILSEFAAKKLLIGEKYQGYSVDVTTDMFNLTIATGEYVVKVDDGTKKRNKKGLVKLGLNEKDSKKQATQYIEAGYKRVLIEPAVNHDVEKEQYVSCTLVRGGVAVLYSKVGGNEVEAGDAPVVSKMISRGDFLRGTTPKLEDVPSVVIETILSAMRQHHFSFVEINPFIQTGDEGMIFLDAAIELDSSKLHILPEWVPEQIQRSSKQSAAELAVAKLDEQSTASFSLTVFNKDAAVFTLLSGGGASLVVLDTLVDNGLQEEVGNYGEYSGAPSREETKIYTNAILSLLFASKAPRKVLVIAGGVANFTDVTTTFMGIIDSCTQHLAEFKEQSVLVRVRRGGPRQAEGLALLESFFAKNNIQAIVSDPSVPLYQVAADTKTFLETQS